MERVLKCDSLGTDVVHSVSNYYETLIAREIDNRQLDEFYDYATLQDIACTSLNQLSARYVRHEVNLLFFSSGAERDSMAAAASDAMDYAIAQVAKRRS